MYYVQTFWFEDFIKKIKVNVIIATSSIFFPVSASDDSSSSYATGDRVTEHVLSPVETVLKSKLRQ